MEKEEKIKIPIIPFINEQNIKITLRALLENSIFPMQKYNAKIHNLDDCLFEIFVKDYEITINIINQKIKLYFKELEAEDYQLIIDNYTNKANNKTITFKIILSDKLELIFKIKLFEEDVKSSLKYRLENNLINIDSVQSSEYVNQQVSLFFKKEKNVYFKLKNNKILKVNVDGVLERRKLSDNCMICLDAVNEYCEISCKHYFCFNCIEEWLDLSNVCPCCRLRFSYIIQLTKDDDGSPKVECYEATNKVLKIVEDDYYDPVENANDYCYKCTNLERPYEMLVCENCYKNCCHIDCLNPPLDKIPTDKWYCDWCVVNERVPTILPIAGVPIRP